MIKLSNDLVSFSHYQINHSNQISFFSEPLSAIKFAAYRVACKLRILQKYLKCKSIIRQEKKQTQ